MGLLELQNKEAAQLVDSVLELKVPKAAPAKKVIPIGSNMA